MDMNDTTKELSCQMEHIGIGENDPYHVCYFDGKFNVLPVNHTKHRHPSILKRRGDRFLNGLTALDWNLVSDFITEHTKGKIVWENPQQLLPF